MKRGMGLAFMVSVAVACSRRDPPRALKPLTLFNTHRQLVAQLDSDDKITDGAAHFFTRYDATTRSMSIDGVTLDVAQSVRVVGARELDVHVGILDPWHIRVLPSNDIEANGHRFGRVEGFEDSTAGAFRLGVLLCALPVMAAPPPADAVPLPPDADPPPPPPPPIPPLQTPP